MYCTSSTLYLLVEMFDPSRQIRIGAEVEIINQFLNLFKNSSESLCLVLARLHGADQTVNLVRVGENIVDPLLEVENGVRELLDKTFELVGLPA